MVRPTEAPVTMSEKIKTIFDLLFGTVQEFQLQYTDLLKSDFDII